MSVKAASSRRGETGGLGVGVRISACQRPACGLNGS
jgi:hypothetical protein